MLGLLGMLGILGLLELVKSQSPQPQGPARPLEVAQPGGLWVLWGAAVPVPPQRGGLAAGGGGCLQETLGSGRVSGTGLPGPPGSARLGEATGRSRLISPSPPGQAQEAPGALAPPCRVLPGPPGPAPSTHQPPPHPTHPSLGCGSHVPKSGAQSQAAALGNGGGIRSQAWCGICPGWAQALAPEPGPPRCQCGAGWAGVTPGHASAHTPKPASSCPAPGRAFPSGNEPEPIPIPSHPNRHHTAGAGTAQEPGAPPRGAMPPGTPLAWRGGSGSVATAPAGSALP